MLPLVIRIKGLDAQASKERQYVFTHSPVRIGRNQLNDLPLPMSFVSLFHALVRFEQKATYVVDLGSTNGVDIDGRRIAKNVPVKVGEGMRVSIGTIEMRLSREAGAAGDGQSRMTQFRALATLMGPDDGTPSTFKPTPIQGRVQVVPTSHLPALDPETLERSRQKGEESPRTQLVPALSDEDLEERDAGQRTIISLVPPEGEAQEKPPPASAPRRHRTLTDSVRVVAPGTGGLQGSIQQLVPLYNAYRSAWEALHTSMVRQGAALPEADRAQLIAQLQQRLSGAVHEPQFEEFARSLGVSVPRPAGGSPGGAALPPVQGSGNRLDAMARDLLGQFVRSYVPGNKGLESGADITRFLDRLAEVLETFGRAFVELRQGHDQFGEEMAVTLANDVTPLTKARSTRDVLRYLLDWKAPDSAQRVPQLMGGFVDVMIHQIALINGMREGVRDLLKGLSPGAQEGGGSFLARLLPFQASRKLRQLEERVRTLIEEERELTSVLFGPEFAKAYLAIVGDAANKGGEGEVSSVSKSRSRES
ncbi:FHA domain-containing protein [Corallococcus exiguus]|uniref:FHA domain-containing protein n=1 Tax=Corallococcus exiguus TaxID=83462 RepID=UPI0014947FBE|nr:FHA domain-containing protein [Corallococcus exiguus]